MLNLNKPKSPLDFFHARYLAKFQLLTYTHQIASQILNDTSPDARTCSQEPSATHVITKIGYGMHVNMVVEKFFNKLDNKEEEIGKYGYLLASLARDAVKLPPDKK